MKRKYTPWWAWQNCVLAVPLIHTYSGSFCVGSSDSQPLITCEPSKQNPPLLTCGLHGGGVSREYTSTNVYGWERVRCLSKIMIPMRKIPAGRLDNPQDSPLASCVTFSRAPDLIWAESVYVYGIAMIHTSRWNYDGIQWKHVCRGALDLSEAAKVASRFRWGHGHMDLLQGWPTACLSLGSIRNMGAGEEYVQRCSKIVLQWP